MTITLSDQSVSSVSIISSTITAHCHVTITRGSPDPVSLNLVIHALFWVPSRLQFLGRSFFIHIYINKFNRCYRTPQVFLINIRICYCQLWQPSWMEFEPFRYISKWGPSKKNFVHICSFGKENILIIFLLKSYASFQ